MKKIFRNNIPKQTLVWEKNKNEHDKQFKKPLVDGNGPLVIRGLNWIGDAVMSFPAIRAIKKHRPSRKLICVARASTAALYDCLDVFSEVWVEDRSFFSRLKMARKIRELSPDGLLIFPNSFSTGLMAKISGAPERVGSDKNLRSIFLTKAVKFPPREETAHECFKFLRLVQEMEFPAPFTRPTIAARELPEKLTLPEGLRLALAPGAAFGGAKRWPAENFAQVARDLLMGREGAVVILGGPSEIAAASEVEAKLSGGPKVLNLAGKTTIQELIAVMAKCHLTISNDSGLMHLSGALDVPVVGLFGPTNPIKTAPLAMRQAVLRHPAPCSPCRHRECPKPTKFCFERLEPDEVVKVATKLLKPTRKSQKTVIWSPTEDQIWPSKTGLELAFFSSATQIIQAGGTTASAPNFVNVFWDALETRNDWFGFVHDHNLDPQSLFWVGDNERFINLANKIGGRSALITTPRAQKIIPDLLAKSNLPTIAVPSWTRALEWITSF
ncbi:MAG: lipopolysaccharide heptosyltransferase II [Deltaproteobacteria bacterium]|jgi:heptosyltransferase-2|nr:lipopolysaccharide heptosyltransferase II [Deltaproteobacteria bacterium]